MPAFRTSKNGRKTSYGSGSKKISRSERAIVRYLDSRLPEAETTPDRMTWPHWAGCKSNPGHAALTAHGEITSPYLKELKRKENQ